MAVRRQENGEVTLSPGLWKGMVGMFGFIILLIGFAFNWGVKLSSVQDNIKTLKETQIKQEKIVKTNTDNINEINMQLSSINTKLDLLLKKVK